MIETGRTAGAEAEAEDDAPGSSTESIHNVGAWPTRWAERAGTRLAVADDTRRLDWAAFEERISRLTGWLQRAGIAPGDRVALLLGNRSPYLELVFACARLGAISLPINLRLSPHEIAYLLEDSTPVACFLEQDLRETLDKAIHISGHRPKQRVVVGGREDAYEAGLAGAPPQSTAVVVSPDDPMMLMYTSGTTGQPKGALLPHRKSLYNAINAQIYFGVRTRDRVLVAAPLFHSLGLQILAMPALYAGAGIVLHGRFDPARVWRSVVDEGISYFGGVPSMHQRLYDELVDAALAHADLESLRFVFTAGSAISVDLIRAFQSRGIVMKQGFGQTESSILCCLDAEDAIRKAGSVGKPVMHVELRVVASDSVAAAGTQSETWRDVAPGESGEIVARGPITMLGYWRKPEATAETLVDGWLRTGDLGSVDDEGYVTLVGRAKDMIISGGENVYPAEVEAVYREHPAIREIAVVGVPDDRWGEIGRAHVLLEPGQPLDLAALEAWARERLAAFKLPKEFVTHEELPRTASGKIQKHKLTGAH